MRDEFASKGFPSRDRCGCCAALLRCGRFRSLVVGLSGPPFIDRFGGGLNRRSVNANALGGRLCHF